MTLATAISTLCLCAVMCATAQEAKPPVLACNLKAISATERPRYNELMKRLRAAVRERSEFPDGCDFRLDGNAITLPEVADWISLEKLCCPFLNFQLSASGSQINFVLKLTGPTGVKALLQEEFPATPRK
jgi:hypothetical protein